MRKLKFVNRHHLRPTSRGGGDRNNIVYLDSKFHAAYHFLFGNMLKEEILLYLEIVMTPGMTWNHKLLYELQEAVKRRDMNRIQTLVEETELCDPEDRYVR